MQTHDSLQCSTAHNCFLYWNKRVHSLPSYRHLLKIRIAVFPATSRFSTLLFPSGFATIPWNCPRIGFIRTARLAHHFLLFCQIRYVYVKKLLKCSFLILSVISCHRLSLPVTLCHFLSQSVSSPLEKNILLNPSFLTHRHSMPLP